MTLRKFNVLRWLKRASGEVKPEALGAANLR